MHWVIGGVGLVWVVVAFIRFLDLGHQPDLNELVRENEQGLAAFMAAIGFLMMGLPFYVLAGGYYYWLGVCCAFAFMASGLGILLAVIPWWIYHKHPGYALPPKRIAWQGMLLLTAIAATVGIAVGLQGPGDSKPKPPKAHTTSVVILVSAKR